MADQIVSAGERCDASATDSECKGKERRSQLPVALSSVYSVFGFRFRFG